MSDNRVQRCLSGDKAIIEIMHGGMAMIVLRNGVLVVFAECKKTKNDARARLAVGRASAAR